MNRYAMKMYTAAGWALVVAVLLAGGCKLAHAVTSTSDIRVTTHRSLTSVAVRVDLAGADTTRTVRLFNWWETTGQDDSGMVLVRRVGRNFYHGRILWMQPNRTANFYVEVTDAGVKTRTATDTVSCSQVRPNVATGPVMYVSKSGNDGTCTGAIGSPCLTITKGLEKLAASTDSGAFGGVIVRPGEYHERVDATFGRDGKPRFISGDRTNRDSTIICGANLHGEAGRRDDTNNFSWVARPVDATTAPSGVYVALLQDGSGEACGTCYGDSISSVIMGWGEYLHRKTSIAAIYADSTGTAAGGDVAAGNGLGDISGWFWAGDSIYVRRNSRAAPPLSGIHFGYRNHLVSVGGRNWSVRNLTVRYGGGPWENPVTDVTRYDPGTGGHGVIAGRSGGNASGLVVDSCRFYGNAGIGVYAAYTDATVRCDSATVANSIFDGLSIGSLDYIDGKNRTEEDANICKVTGSRSNIYKCAVSETHNGYQVSPGAGANDSTWAYETEVYGNTAQTLSDDALEMDGVWGVNLLVANNTTDYSNSGISVAPLYEGPVFFLYNTCTRFKSAGIKIGGDTEAVMRFYHNTFASEQSGSRAYEGFSGGTIRFVELENNILSGQTAIALNDTAGFGTCRFNYNCLDSTAGGRIVTNSGDPSVGFGAWQGEYLQDPNGTYGNIKLNSVYPRVSAAWPRADARIKKSSPAYRAGRRITGVNCGGITGNRYLVRPHIGSKSCTDCWKEEAERP